ncbi:MAG: CDP-glycerol glycerophosphotransferase family protein [Akkermansia sp.]|nr:CDP-glycerol glycerophosphotransferase family protein [Akkermansia sp.]
MNNQGRNLAIVGHPYLDYLREGKNYCLQDMNNMWKNYRPGIKKLIWAPHWTIGNQSFYSNGSFLSICDDMVNLAKQHADRLLIAFKPHPILYRALCDHPDWGQEKTDAYYKQWATMPNTQVEEGEYRELFWSSDAMIHDCGSFIIEYPIVNKPCMYLQRGEGYSDFNEFAKAALNCYTIGKNAEDIEKFIIEQVIGAQDPKKDVRVDFIEQYLSPVGGKTAAENIIESILTFK